MAFVHSVLRESAGGHKPRSRFRCRGYCLALRLAISVAILLTMLHPSPLLAQQDSESEIRQFIDGVAETLYFFAWPTAAFKKVTFGGIDSYSNGFDVRVRLHGVSAFSDGALWTDLILKVRNDRVTDLAWGRHNAILMAPGATMQALGEALDELTKEYNRSTGAGGGSSQTYEFHFSNKCNRPIQLAIRYEKSSGGWETRGWWEFEAHESAYLSANGTRIRSGHGHWYYFAETTDGSRLVWKGDHTFTYGGRNLPMRRLEDKEGENNWSATCP